MKRKSLLLAVTALLVVGMGACGSSDNSGGNNSTEEYSPESVSIKEIPYEDLQLNDARLGLKDVSVYRETSESGYGYYIGTIITFDKSGLSDSDFYWLQEDNSFSVSCYCTSEENKLDFESMPLVKGYYDDNDDTMTYVFYDNSEEHKNDFSDAEIDISIRITQDEEYEHVKEDGTTSMMNKYILYTAMINSGTSGSIDVDIKDADEMDESQRDYWDRALSTLS